MQKINEIKTRNGVRFKTEVCVGGIRKSKRFNTKLEAESWAVEQKVLLSCGGALIHGKTVGDAFERYSKEISSTKKGERWECIRLRKFQTDPIAKVPLTDLNLSDAELFRDRALMQGLKAGTVVREMNLIKHVIRWAVKWKYLARYPWESYQNPKQDAHRDRIISHAEITTMVRSLGLVHISAQRDRSFQSNVTAYFN